MLRNFFRKTVKEMNEYDKKILIVNKEFIKINIIISLIIYILTIIPIIIIVFLIISRIENLILDVMAMTSALLIIFIVLYMMQKDENNKIASFLFGRKYAKKGKAITEQDFEILKEKDKPLYKSIIRYQSTGKCYSTSFKLLKTLKKGSMKYVGIRVTDNERKNQKHNCYYTMHAIYVKNGWCYDTYSGKQYPLNEFLSIFEAIECMEFDFESIKSKEYEDFKQENVKDFINWSRMNNCKFV